MKKFKIRSGDEVIIISGSQKGKIGRVLKVLPQDSKVLISGVNIVSKHQKPSSSSAGGIVEKEMPIHISNVSLRDIKTNLPIKVKFLVEQDSKVRVNKKTGQQVKFVRS